MERNQKYYLFEIIDFDFEKKLNFEIGRMSDIVLDIEKVAQDPFDLPYSVLLFKLQRGTLRIATFQSTRYISETFGDCPKIAQTFDKQFHYIKEILRGKPILKSL